MHYGTVAGLDKPVSRIVFGTDRLQSKRLPRLPNRSLERQAFALLNQCFELGCNSFDTARIYGDSERTLGAWIRDRRNRDDVVIISKGCHPSRMGSSRLSAADVSRDLHASLKALGTDHIDVYLLHRDDPTARYEPVIEQLNRHVDEGKICSIGASNWSEQRLNGANQFALDNGLRPFGASSVQFSLADWIRPPWPGSVSIGGVGEQSAREWYSAHTVSVIAYSSLARGFFSDYFDPKHADDNSVSQWCAKYFGTEENLERLERAKSLAREMGVTEAQVALAYVLSHPLRVFAVVGCATSEKFALNVAALSLELSESTLDWLAHGKPSS